MKDLRLMEKQGELRESLKDTDWAWIAGFVDGEGCLTFNTGTRESPVTPGLTWTYYRPRFIIVNTDEAVMRFLGTVFESNVTCRPAHDNLRAQYAIEVSARKKLQWILPKLLPYLRIKKAQAEILLQVVSLPRGCTAQKQRLWQQFDQAIIACGQKRRWGGNSQPSRQMKHAGGRFDGQPVPRTGMSGTSALAERHDMTCSSEKSEETESRRSVPASRDAV